jgi:hypothetical protein
MIRHKTDGWAAKNIIGNKSTIEIFRILHSLAISIATLFKM